MSTLKVAALQGVSASSDAITLANDGSCTANITNNLSNRRLTINGDMKIAQRGTSATGTGYKTVDRFTSQGSGSQGLTQSQDTDVPTGQGFSKSLKFDCTTANASPSAGDNLAITYKIEAQDLQQIANGTSSAKKLTLSFWVKSPKTGNHAVGLYKDDNTGRQNTKTYSVSAANTWEKKTVTYDGDTSGGGIANDNGLGIQINWFLLAGSNFTSVDSTSWVNYSDAAWAYGHAVNVFDNTANNFYITGVQLEVGSVATDFEHRSFGQELALCQRYFEQSYDYGTAAGTATSTGCNNNGGLTGVNNASHATRASIQYKVTKKGIPTVTTFDLSGNSGKCNFPDTSANVTMTVLQGGANGCGVETSAVTSTDTRCYWHFTAESEL